MSPVAIFPSSNTLMHYSEGSELCMHGNMCTATQQPWPDSPLLHCFYQAYVFKTHTECCWLLGWDRGTVHACMQSCVYTIQKHSWEDAEQSGWLLLLFMYSHNAKGEGELHCSYIHWCICTLQVASDVLCTLYGRLLHRKWLCVALLMPIQGSLFV